MSIIYRPPREFLDESMAGVKYFDSFESLQKYIVEKMKPYIKLRECEIIASNEKTLDKRIGWIDSDYLLIDKYENIQDKDGYIKYYRDKYDNPLCIGFLRHNGR